MARNRTRAERTAAKARTMGVTIVASDGALKSALGVMLWRCWLYSGALPGYQAVSLMQQMKPLAVEREGFTHYYR